MNGAHDMGGMQCMGPVEAEENEPVFHGDWERRVLAVTLAAGAMGRWNIDMARFAREDTPAADYLRRSYYETWLYGLEKLLTEKGIVTREEIEGARQGRHAEKAAEPALTKAQVAPALARGTTARVDKDVAPRFRTGDRVRLRNFHPRGHTRAPRYLRGHDGTIECDHGVFVFPDTHAVDGTKKPQHLYAVRFAAEELWGPDAARPSAVYADLWDDYLEPTP